MRTTRSNYGRSREAPADRAPRQPAYMVDVALGLSLGSETVAVNSLGDLNLQSARRRRPGGSSGQLTPRRATANAYGPAGNTFTATVTWTWMGVELTYVQF